MSINPKSKRYQPEAHQEWQRKYRRAKPKTFILYRAKQNAKTRGIPFSLMLKDIPDIPKRCSVLQWIELEYRVGEGSQDSSPSLDRIDNTRGYEPGNVRIISQRANVLKSNATDKELQALARDSRRNTKKSTVCNEPLQQTQQSEQSPPSSQVIERSESDR